MAPQPSAGSAENADTGSENRPGRAEDKDLKSGLALTLNRRVCAPNGGVENSAGAVKALEEKAYSKKQAAGATANLKNAASELVNFAWWMKKQGYNNLTIGTRVKLLRVLVKRGAILNDPESVKEAIARQSWSGKRKMNAADAYLAFLRMKGGAWDPPKFRVKEKLPYS